VFAHRHPARQPRNMPLTPSSPFGPPHLAAILERWTVDQTEIRALSPQDQGALHRLASNSYFLLLDAGEFRKYCEVVSFAKNRRIALQKARTLIRCFADISERNLSQHPRTGPCGHAHTFVCGSKKWNLLSTFDKVSRSFPLFFLS